MHSHWFSFEGRLMIFLTALMPLFVSIFGGADTTMVVMTIYMLLLGGALLTEYGPGFLFKRDPSTPLEQMDSRGFLLHVLLHPMSLLLTVVALYWFQYAVSVTGEWMWFQVFMSAAMAMLGPVIAAILYALRRGIDSMSGPDSA